MLTYVILPHATIKTLNGIFIFFKASATTTRTSSTQNAIRVFHRFIHFLVCYTTIYCKFLTLLDKLLILPYLISKLFLHAFFAKIILWSSNLSKLKEFSATIALYLLIEQF